MGDNFFPFCPSCFLLVSSSASCTSETVPWSPRKQSGARSCPHPLAIGGQMPSLGISTEHGLAGTCEAALTAAEICITCEWSLSAPAFTKTSGERLKKTLLCYRTR